MDVNSFYGTRTCTLQAHVPETPQDSDLSDVDDPIEDPDYHPVMITYNIYIYIYIYILL